MDFIRNNNSLFRIFSIGIGDNIDEELIKRIGSIGRGGFDFCKKYEDINSVVDKNVNNVINPWIHDLKIKCCLDNDNIYEQDLPKKIRQNELIKLKYKIPKNYRDKVYLRVIYNANNNEKIDNKFEIIPKEIPEGEDLSKLIIKDLINSMKKEDEKKEISLKYQIFNNYTSLFAEVELSDKITEEMKLKIIGNKKKNILEISNMEMGGMNMNMGMGGMGMNMGMGGMDLNFGMNNKNNMNMMNMGMNNINMMGMGMNNMNMMNMGMNNMNIMNMGMNNMNMMNMGMNNMNTMNMGMNMGMNKFVLLESLMSTDNKDLLVNPVMHKKKIMKIIKTQNFINGYWGINEQTKFILKDYKEDYELLKKFMSVFYQVPINLQEHAIITFIIICYINEQYFKLISELTIIFKKAKLFIEKEIKDSYEQMHIHYFAFRSSELLKEYIVNLNKDNINNYNMFKNNYINLNK